MLSPMLPHLGPFETHGLFVGLGVLAAALVFVTEARRRGQTDDRLFAVVAGALVGGAIFMRMGTWLQHVDLRDNATLTDHLRALDVAGLIDDDPRSDVASLVEATLQARAARLASGKSAAA